MSFFRGHFGPIWGLFCVILAQNLKLSQASHVKTQKDRKRSRIPIKMASYSYSEPWSQGKLKLDPMHLMWSNKHVLAQKIETLCIYLCHEGDICGPTGV